MNEIMKIGLTADVGQFITNMGKASMATEALGAAFGAVRGVISKATAEMHKALIKLAAGTAGIVASLAGATMAASSYESGLRNVQSITKDTWATTSGLGSALLDFSRTSTVSAGDLVNSLYDVASSGFAGADALGIVKASAVAASAGMSDAKTAGFALSGVLNAYGKSASDVTSVSDTLFQTVNLGVLTFGDLAEGMGEWVSTAAAAKVPLEEASAALATITRAGVQAPEAATGLARVIQSFLNPTKEMSKAVKVMGYESGAAMLQQIGLKKSVELVGQVTGGAADKIIKYFGDIRGGRAALALLANAGENYNTVARGFTDQTQLAGATQKAFAIQARGLGAQLTMLKNNLHANVIEIGQYLLPSTRSATSVINKLVSGFSELPGPMKGVLAAGTALTAMVMGAVAVWGLWYLKTGLLKKAIGTSNIAFLGISKALLAISTASGSERMLGVAGAFEKASFKGGKFRGTLSLVNSGLAAMGISSKAALIGFVGITAVVVGATAGYIAWSAAVKNANKHAKEFIATLQKSQDLTSQSGVSAALDDVGRKLRMAENDSRSFGDGFGRALQRTAQNLTPMKNGVEESEAKIRALRLEQSRLLTTQEQWVRSSGNVNAEIVRLTRNTGDSGKNIHLTSDETIALAKSLGVDLSQGGEKGEAGLTKVAQAAIDASDAGIAMGTNYGKAADQVVAMSQKAGEAAQKFADGVKETIRGTFDVVGKFGGSVIEDFNKFKLEAPRNAKTGKLLKDANGKPLPKVKVMIEGVFKKDEITNFYKAALRENEVFRKDLADGIRGGLNPNLITKFMESGASESGKLLHTLMGDADLRDMANRYEATLQRMSVQSSEVARITALALQSPTDKLTKDLPKALAVAQNVMLLHGNHMTATFEAVAKAAHLPVSVVERIGTEFGISMTKVIRSFKDLPISEELSKVLSDQMINVKAPRNMTDVMVRNFINGDEIFKGVTKEMLDNFGKKHPELEIRTNLALRELGKGAFKGMNEEDIFGKILGARGVHVKALLELVPDYRNAVELKQLLRADNPPTKIVNALLKFTTDKSDPESAMKALLFAAESGQISAGTLQFGLKMIATPEALLAYKELKKERELHEGRPITFKFDGKEVKVGLDGIEERVKGLGDLPPVKITTVETVQSTSHTMPIKIIDPAKTIDKTGAVYQEIVREAKTDKIIKIFADGSVEITREKLAAINKGIAGLPDHPVKITTIHEVQSTSHEQPITIVDPTKTIDRTGAVYKEIVKESKKNPSIKIHADGSVVITRDRLTEIVKKVTDIKKNKKNNVDVLPGPNLDPTRRKVKDIYDKLVGITSRTWTVNINTKGKVPDLSGGSPTGPSPYGGAAYGGVYRMAEGGVDTKKRPYSAHVVKKPTVLYGEEGTGGEAYIPLAMTRRKRSELLLAQVAKIFGMKVTKMATGGITDFVGRLKHIVPQRSGESISEWNIRLQQFVAQRSGESISEWRARIQQELGISAAPPKPPPGGTSGGPGGMGQAQSPATNIIKDVSWNQAHLADITHTMAGSASFAKAVAEATKGLTDAKEKADATQAALAEMAKTYKDVQMAAGTSAANQLAASGLVGDAWQQAADRIIQAAADTKDRWNNIWTDLWTKGKITSSTYFTYLKSQMAKLPAYSQEWLQLRDSIAEIAKGERQVKFEVGDMSAGAYLAVLKKQMAATRKYSAEWKALKDEIESVEKEHEDHIANIQDRAYQQNRLGTTEYLADLQKRLAGTKKWSSEYMSILSQIDQIKQSFKDPILNAANAIQEFGSTAPQGFGEISNYFTHAIEAAKRYNADLAQLRQMGLDKNLLMQLMQAGPSSVPFMDAIIRGGAEAVKETNANQATLTALSGQTMAATLGGPGSVEGIRGAASQVTTNNNQQTLTIGSITIGEGNGVTATQIRNEIGQAFNTLTSELQKRNN